MGPPVFAYFLIIVLSGLHLDIRICRFAGTVAAVQYLAFYYYFYSQLTLEAVATVIAAPVPNVVKAIILFLTGVLTGIATSQIKNRIVESFEILEERNKVLDIFGQHVSPSVVEKLVGGKEYTVIGDVVNLASRIDSLNQQYRAQLLISEEIWNTIDRPDLPEENHLGPVQVKGREEPIHIYRLR